MKGTTIPATSHNLWTGSRAIWLGVIILRHGGTASLRPVCLRTGTAYTSQVLYGPNLLRNNFRGFYFPFADPSRIFRGHMLKPFYINANTRTFRSMLICVYIYTCSHENAISSPAGRQPSVCSVCFMGFAQGRGCCAWVSQLRTRRVLRRR